MANFTPQQQQAIDCDATNILVSAAAGSGKTAVLTERILRHVKQGKSIDDLLIVTFTEAASAEMRERIGKKLAEAGQSASLMRLPMANISTIHSFCRKLVQEHFQAVDIDPAFRVGDTAELTLIRKQVMDELFEQEYETNPQFIDLADVYGGKTMDGRLDVLVRKIHDFMESDPFPLAAAQRYADIFEIDRLDTTPWATIVREELMLGLDGALEGLRQALAICNTSGGPGKYIDKLEAEAEMLGKLKQETHDDTFEEMHRAFVSIDWGSLPRTKDESDPDLVKQVQDIRNEAVKKRINKLVDGIFFAPPGKMKDDLTALAPRVNALMQLAIKFSEAFAAEKRARNLLDFSDLEHFAIRILYPNGEGTPPAQLYQFYEVLIDEYQDSNRVQDMILSAVAARRFMVGDVKQSIYRFRRANPELFQEKYRSYSTQASGENVRIDLSHNFRSRPEVLDAVNFFFAQLMCEKVGEVEYDDSAALHAGHDKYPQMPTDKAMWVELLDQSEEFAPDDEDEETPDNVIAETRVIARCIQELLDETNPRLVWDSNINTHRPCEPGDIAILTRGLSSMAGAVIEELKNHGIDAIADMDAGFLNQLEVKTALALLRVIDNPRQDIDLITVLHSPVYGFTADELLQIKHSSDALPNFYDYLLIIAKQDIPLAKKVQNFLRDLQSWREIVPHTPISRLMGIVYDTTKYPAHVLAMPGGVIRQANLRLVLERAIEFEETSMKGLFHFVNYIERLYDSDVKTSGAVAEPAPSPKGRVRIMTIHKSKGLEFPVVICAFLGKKFNTDDTRQPVILHSGLGVGPYYVDTKLRTRANTLARFSLARLTVRENLSEEMRCLYVALTRAKELLILTARSKNLPKAIEKWGNYIGNTETSLPAYYRSGVASYLDWLMPCLLRHRAAAELTTAIDVNQVSDIWNHAANFRIRCHNVYAAQNIEHTAVAETDTTTMLKPFDTVAALPSKLSISEIKRLYDITPDSTLHTDPPPTFNPPEFMQEKSGLTPAQLGTALHMVAEHLDYSTHITPQAIEGLIYDLTDKNLLTPQEAAFIDRGKIMELVCSPLADRIRKSPNVKRETPFVLALPAGELYADAPSGETVLVHGIIDCYFEEDGEIVLVDYKSDAQPEKHKTQMEIYKKAIAEATALRVKEVLIYSFALGREVRV